VAEVPFPEYGCAVTILAENIGHRHFITPQDLAATRRIPHTRMCRVTPRQECGSRRRAAGIDMKIN
jgi:hypothetical protein